MTRLKRTGWEDQITEWASVLENEMAPYVHDAVKAEKAFRLQAFDDNERKYWKDTNKEIVELPIPRNVVLMFQRLLGGALLVNVLSGEEKAKAKDTAELVEMWLQGFFYRVQREQRINVKYDMAWWGTVRGRFVNDVRWVGDNDNYKDSRLPIKVTSLDPLNLLVGWAGKVPVYAIHRYVTTVLDVRDRWGRPGKKVTKGREEQDEVTVFDYWDEEENAVSVDGEKIVAPRKHEYEGLPFIIGFADSTPLNEEKYRGVSPLLPFYDTWRYQCRAASMVMQALKTEFWKALLVFDPNNDLSGSVDASPGAINVLTAKKGDAGVEELGTSPNMGVLEAFYEILGNQIDMSTFPSVMYGETPGAQTSGFAISTLTSAAQGRVGPLRESMELALADTCALVLRLVKNYSKSGGVSVWTADEGETLEAGILTLNKKDLADDMPIVVRLGDAAPRDDTARGMQGLRMAELEIISKETAAEEYADLKYPRRERKRMLVQRAMEDPRVMQAYIKQAFEEEEGVPYDSVGETGQGLQGADGMVGGGIPQDQAMVPPPMPGGAPGGPGLPPGMAPPGGVPGPPGVAGPQLPPMPPSMMQGPQLPAMPPSMMPGAGPQLPPMPPSMAQGMPPQMMPPAMMGAAPQQMMPGVPPEIAAQLRGAPPPMPPRR